MIGGVQEHSKNILATSPIAVGHTMDDLLLASRTQGSPNNRDSSSSWSKVSIEDIFQQQMNLDVLNDNNNIDGDTKLIQFQAENSSNDNNSNNNMLENQNRNLYSYATIINSNYICDQSPIVMEDSFTHLKETVHNNLKSHVLPMDNSIQNKRSKSPKQSGIRLRIVDARPSMAAFGNAILGKGHEVVARLGGKDITIIIIYYYYYYYYMVGPDVTTIKFVGIANIHAMRESLAKLRCACTDTENPNWLLNMHNSNWLQHISSLLQSSVYIATRLSKGDPVVVHCSDGWDRTSQLVVLVQILSDPHYRTIAGLRDLLYKDFISFGHQFHKRGGMIRKEDSSPIFLQLIDCIWQIWRQFPAEFEYSDALLLLLVHAQLSRYTGDYVYDSVREYEQRFECYEMLYSRNLCSHCSKGNKDEHALVLDDWPRLGSSANSNSNVCYDTTKSESGKILCPECLLARQTAYCSIWDVIARDLDSYLNPLYHVSTKSNIGEHHDTPSPFTSIREDSMNQDYGRHASGSLESSINQVNYQKTNENNQIKSVMECDKLSPPTDIKACQENTISNINDHPTISSSRSNEDFLRAINQNSLDRPNITNNMCSDAYQSNPLSHHSDRINNLPSDFKQWAACTPMLSPRCHVSSLQVWSALHSRGIPGAVTTNSSYAVEMALRHSLRERQDVMGMINVTDAKPTRDRIQSRGTYRYDELRPPENIQSILLSDEEKTRDTFQIQDESFTSLSSNKLSIIENYCTMGSFHHV